MPPQTRKKTEPTPAQAAVAEALEDGDVAVEFRGQQFVIKRETRLSAKVAMALASGQDHVFLYHLLGPVDSDRFIRLCKPGEPFTDVSAEWFEAYGKASGQGNS